MARRCLMRELGMVSSEAGGKCIETCNAGTDPLSVMLNRELATTCQTTLKLIKKEKNQQKRHILSDHER